MQQEEVIEGYYNVTKERRKSGIYAKLDFLQSATGLILALFMIVHMFLVSSILISDEAMYKVAKFFEGSLFLKMGEPAIVSVVASGIILILVVHAFLAVRKFPINYRQYKIFKTHKHLMKHGDTSLWFTQVATGFFMFFLASVHLFVMLTEPSTIGPHGSSYRFVTQHFWLLYIFLLFAVELHGSIGLYRLAIKWGWFKNVSIQGLRSIKWAMSVFFIVLGLCTYGAYIKKGLENQNSGIHTMQQAIEADEKFHKE
ncbi:fumarate reductase cytochrome b subunit [Helicobacter cetorum]|uniref:Fumarate reductase cytochrome b subunit n=1 Tax=Helicobacter cetorum (strain ATCC BAA-429 / MIT 00-7128) TaxID=182217 RepID=I0ELQ9_HELC0|nr:fumarate reductase cytochrome b subunit [Helicobacter cetorum]AFI03878.1 fumarate reductase cytochrome b-556 subunit [Helicobacter cetorum MIT 00-7128]